MYLAQLSKVATFNILCMKRLNKYYHLLLLCLFCICTLNAYAQGSSTITKNLNLADLISKVVDEGLANNTSAPNGAQPGHRYSVTYNGWSMSLNDAYIDKSKGIVNVYQASYIRIETSPNRRIQKIQWGDYSEKGGVYIHTNTYNGNFQATYLNKGTQGNGTVKNAVWTPRFNNTEYKVSFVVLGKERESHKNGYISFKSGITVSYTESSSFKEKIDPVIKVEFPVLNTNINKTKITEPTTVVYEDAECTKRIASDFIKNFFIDMEPIQDPCEDSQTHSKIELRTGQITTGDNTGSFKVVVRCYPKDQEQAERYNTSVASYLVNVAGREGFIKYNDHIVDNADKSLDVKVYKGIAVEQPEIKIVDESGKDISDKYDFTNPKVDWGAFIENQYITKDNENKTFVGIKETNGVINIKLTIRPKDNEKKDYADATVNINLQVLPLPSGKIKTHVIYESTELSEDKNDLIILKRNSHYFNELVIRVYDDLNNDISSMFDFDPFSVTPKIIGENRYYPRLTITSMTAEDAIRENNHYKNDPTFHKVKEGDPELNTLQYITEDGNEVKLQFNIPVLKEFRNTISSIEDILYVKIIRNTPDIVFNPQILTIKRGNTRSYGSYKAYDDIRSSKSEIDNIEIKYRGIFDENGNNVTENNPITFNRGYITANTVGKYKILYYVYGYNNFDDGYAYQTLEIVAKVNPIASFSDTNIAVPQNTKTVEPTLTIVDDEGNDISDKYTIVYSASFKPTNWLPSEKYVEPVSQNLFLETSSFYTYYNKYWQTRFNDYYYYNNYREFPEKYVGSSTGKLNTNAAEGVYTIYADLLAKDPENYENKSISYTLDLYASNWNYNIISKQGADYGKLVVYRQQNNGNTQLKGGTTIDGVPGLKVQIGAKGSSGYTIQPEDHNTGNYYIRNGKVILDGGKKTENGIAYLPTGGMFLKLFPITDGFVTIDAEWIAGKEYVLVDINGDKINREVFIPAKNGHYAHTFSKSLRATDDCYMYLMPKQNDGSELRIFGVNYEPAFIKTASDVTPVTSATAYLNVNKKAILDENNKPTGKYEDVTVMHKDGLPYIVHSATDYVEQKAQNYNGHSGEQWLTIAKDGNITLNHVTTDTNGNYAIPTSHNDGEIRVDGKTTGNQTVNAQTLRVYAKVTSATHPEVFKQAYFDLIIRGIPTYMVSANFTPDVRQKITEVEGINLTWGGWKDKDKISYIKDDHEIQDSWRESNIDAYGVHNETVDGFSYMCNMGGDSNAKDEVNANFTPGTNNFYNLPCRGDYVKLEPTKAGTVYLYVLQNGCVDWNGGSLYDKGGNDKIKWRPLYIVDEHGEAVELNKNARFGTQTGTGAKTGAYTESKFRCNNTLIEGTTPEKDLEGKDFIFNASSLTDDQMSYFTNKTYWPNDARRQPQSVIGIGQGGYIMVSKGYVRYTFDVLPGKSYYIFQLNSKMGLAGFSFDSSDDTPEDITLSAKETFEPINVKHANITYNRKLKKDKFNAFILPFSMNVEQVEKYFGKGTKISYFEDANSESSHIDFIRHYYQMIVAGEPCLIKPTFEGTEAQPDESGWVSSVQINDVSLDERQPRQFLSKDGNWVFSGNYDYQHILKANSYYVSDGKLYRYAESGHWVNALYSFLEPTTSNAKTNFLISFSDENGNKDDDTVTGIEDIITENGTEKQQDFAIYNLQGQKLQYENLSKVPAGIYIINGKKTIVK